jgi:hypothetical protein
LWPHGTNSDSGPVADLANHKTALAALCRCLPADGGRVIKRLAT